MRECVPVLRDGEDLPESFLIDCSKIGNVQRICGKKAAVAGRIVADEEVVEAGFRVPFFAGVP
jgi:hypothetical protein